MSYNIPAPFSPACNAARIWGVDRPTELDVQVHLRDDDVSKRRPNNIGGLNPEDDASVAVNYDPRTVSMRAPVESDTLMGTKHGPSAFSNEAQPKPKVQYGTVGDLIIDPVYLTPRRLPCLCVDTCLFSLLWPYSMSTLVYTIRNALSLRCLLQQSGAVLVSPELAATQSYPCVCSVFGDADDIAKGLFGMAQENNEAPIITTPNPNQTLQTLNVQYVQNMVSGLRSLVNDKLRYNYASVEGNRAYLQSYPEYIDPTPRGTEYFDRAISDPKASAMHRCVLSKLTGLPINK